MAMMYTITYCSLILTYLLTIESNCNNRFIIFAIVSD